MKKICINCQSENIEEITKGDQRFFYCKNCKKLLPRFKENESNLVSYKDDNRTVHVTVGILIKRKANPKEYLFLKKRSFPYEMDLPAGHMEYGENSRQAAIREAMEETGLKLVGIKLVYEGLLDHDPCRYGSDIHKWYVFEATADKEDVFVNSEANDFTWLTINDALKKKLVGSAREILSNFCNEKSPDRALLGIIRSPRKDALLGSLKEKQAELIYHLSQVFFRTKDTDVILDIAKSEIKSAMGLDAVEILLKDQNNIAKNQIRSRAKAIIKSPISLGSDHLGEIIALSLNKRLFTEAESQFLKIVSSQLAVAIENSRLLEEIKTERDTLNKIIANVNEGVFAINPDGKIVIWNKFLEDILGLPAKKLIGRDASSIAEKIGLKDLIEDIARDLKSSSSLQSKYVEHKLQSSNGDKNWFGITISYIQAQDDEPYAVITCRNISQEKELLKAKDDLISTATHELRTPVTAIKGYLSMVLHGDAGEINEEQNKFLKRAFLSTERLVDLLEDLLSALRIDENKTVINEMDFEFSEILKQSLDNLKQKAEFKNIKIKANVNKVFVHGDPEKSRHIIDNLIDNAIKYTRDNGKIEIKVEDKKQNILISVKDNGVGISEKSMSFIFDRFSRVHNPLSVKAGGTGLGLYIAKNLVEKQGGRIWLESNVNKGTTFYFTIPSPINIKNS